MDKSAFLFIITILITLFLCIERSIPLFSAVNGKIRYYALILNYVTQNIREP